MARVLVVGHGAAATGFSRVVHALIHHLSHDHEFHHFAINHRDERVAGDWPIYGNPDPLDALGLERLDGLIRELQPAILLMVNDLWYCSVHGQRLARMRDRPITIAYCPVDGLLTRPSLYAAVGLFDQVVAYTEFGRAQLGTIPGEGPRPGARIGSGRLKVISHGVDRDTFFPFAPGDVLDRSQAKRQLFGPGAEDGFVVLNAAKHDARKRLDLTIGGFARFARGKPADVRLYLHTAARFEGSDLRELARRAGISDRLITTPGWLEHHPGVDSRQLNLIYNACDVGVNTSSGEGWGLVSLEHAATGAPQVVPSHTGCGEVWQGVQTLLPTRREAEHMGLGMRREFVGEDDVADVLERLYADREFRCGQARQAYMIAQRPAYRWPEIAREWNTLFGTVLEHGTTVAQSHQGVLSYAE